MSLIHYVVGFDIMLNYYLSQKLKSLIERDNFNHLISTLAIVLKILIKPTFVSILHITLFFFFFFSNIARSKLIFNFYFLSKSKILYKIAVREP